MLIITEKEIDVINSGDCPVSSWLRVFLCDWIDRNHWTSVSTNSYYNEYNKCFICSNIIENKDDIAVATGGKGVAHFDSGDDIGFRNYFSKEEYDEIISELYTTNFG